MDVEPTIKIVGVAASVVLPLFNIENQEERFVERFFSYMDVWDHGLFPAYDAFSIDNSRYRF